MARAEALVGTDDTTDLVDAFYAALAPPRQRTVSEWADDNRVLDSRSPEPGPWRTDKVPYLREIQDRLSANDPCQRVVWMKAAQVAGTECILNAIGYWIEDAPGPILAVQPTVELFRDWSKDRLQLLIETAPRVKELVGDGSDNKRDRDADNSIRYKRFPGGSLFGAGANSPAGLRSKPVRYLALDEIDAYPDSAGKEGDPVRLAERRTQNFKNKKIVLVSTPTVKDMSRIEKAYKNSDQRRYFVYCPHCNHKQWLKWDNIMFEVNAENQAIESSVFYACEKSGCVIEESDKVTMLEGGEWIAQNPGGGDGRTHGYHISTLYSPWKSWFECVQEFVEAKPPGQPPNLHLLQVFINTVLGETWDDTGGREANAHELMRRREVWWAGDTITVPRAAAFLTAGVDTQDDRLEGTVWAWGPGREGWIVDRFIVIGLPSEQSTWDDLDAFLDKQYIHESGVYIGIAATCIDHGGHHSQDVLRYTNNQKSKRRYAIRGTPGMSKPIWSGRLLVGRKRKTGGALYPVGVDSAKTWLYSCLNADINDIRLHFPNTSEMKLDWCDNQFFTQLCAEKRRPKHLNGHLVYVWWKPDHAANEMLDATIYAVAGMESLTLSGRKLDRIPVGLPVPKGSSALPRPVAEEVEERRSEPVPRPVRREGMIQANRNWLSRG